MMSLEMESGSTCPFTIYRHRELNLFQYVFSQIYCLFHVFAYFYINNDCAVLLERTNIKDIIIIITIIVQHTIISTIVNTYCKYISRILKCKLNNV